MPPLALLNTSILTNFGDYRYSPLSLEDAQQIVAEAATEQGECGGLLSAIGHASTAAILTDLLGVEVAMNRIQFAQEPGQYALVFKLKGRAPEGVILSREEIEAIGYEFGLIFRLA